MDWDNTAPLRVIIGAGEQAYDGWVSTQREDLDLLDHRCWEDRFAERKADAFLCEHVWEHLTEQEGRSAARYCYQALKPGGYLRCAVPDRNFPHAAYQHDVQIGGPGPAEHPAADHKIVYDYRTFVSVFEGAGFETVYLPCMVDGCGLAVGDFHYPQGDGEVAGTEIEMGGRMTVTARITEDPPNLAYGPHYEGPASVLRIPSKHFYVVTGIPVKPEGTIPAELA